MKRNARNAQERFFSGTVELLRSLVGGIVQRQCFPKTLKSSFSKYQVATSSDLAEITWLVLMCWQ